MCNNFIRFFPFNVHILPSIFSIKTSAEYQMQQLSFHLQISLAKLVRANSAKQKLWYSRLVVILIKVKH